MAPVLWSVPGSGVQVRPVSLPGTRRGLDMKAVVLEPRRGSLSPGGHGVITPLLGVSKAFGP